MFSKKSIVLTGIEKEREKGVLSIEKKDEFYNGKLRLYNFVEEPSGILSIGFFTNKKVVKSGLTKNSNMVYSFIIDKNKLDDDFSCAIINFSQGTMKPILYGNTDGEDNLEVKLAKIMNTDLDEINRCDETEKILTKNEVFYDEDYVKSIEKEIDCEMCKTCENCKYKKAYFEKENIVQIEEKKGNYYETIKNQLNDLFAKNKSEEILEELIPNSKWVKVDYEEDGDYYIVGLIYEEAVLKYIAYGFPGIYQKVPPKEIAGYPIWFPLDEKRSDSFGYWLSYQDAETGESLKAEVQ